MTAALVALIAASASLAYFVYHFWRASNALGTRIQHYSGIADVQAAVDAAKVELDSLRREAQEFSAKDQRRRNLLESEYKGAIAKYQALQQEVSLLEENLDDISFGLYQPHFSFETSEQYKDALIGLRQKMKLAIKNGTAIASPSEYTVNGSRQQGARMVRQISKLMLRALNGECDAAVANVRYDNIRKMEERVDKSFEAINKMGETLQLLITNEYLRIRLDEIRLVNEYECKKYEEKEHERERRDQMRDAEKAQREIEQAQQEAEQQEATYLTLLEKARREAAEATGVTLRQLTDKVSEFSAKLDEARRKKEKAIARAQLTKSGFVYIISNVGSFGDDVVKIGMTRRMEPLERVMELSGAAVPFPFDVHAMLYSDDAPALEAELHQFVSSRRMNLVNTRKEFFAGVKLTDIKTFVEARGLSAQFIEQPEARDYRESMARRKARQGTEISPPERPKFSSSPFAAAQTA